MFHRDAQIAHPERRLAEVEPAPLRRRCSDARRQHGRGEVEAWSVFGLDIELDHRSAAVKALYKASKHAVALYADQGLGAGERILDEESRPVANLVACLVRHDLDRAAGRL